MGRLEGFTLDGRESFGKAGRGKGDDNGERYVTNEHEPKVA